MEFQSFVIAMTTSLLTAPDARLNAIWSRCDQYMESSILAQEGKPSVAIWEGYRECIPLRQWIALARARKIRRIRAAIHFDRNELPPHKMAGFAGGRPWNLEVAWQDGMAIYRAGTVTSPSHAMTISAFSELIRSQKNPDFYWKKILEEINQFHSCNNIEEVTSLELPAFLASPAADHAWKFIGDTLFQEIQVEAYTFNQSFIIPQHLATLVEPVQSFIEDIQPDVSLEIYDDVDVTGEQLFR